MTDFCCLLNPSLCRAFNLNDLLPSPQTFVYTLLFEWVGEVESDLNSIMFFSLSLSLTHRLTNEKFAYLTHFFCMCFKTCLTSHSPTLSQRCTLICSFWFSFSLIVWFVVNSFFWLMFHLSVQTTLFFLSPTFVGKFREFLFNFSQIFDFYAPL